MAAKLISAIKTVLVVLFGGIGLLATIWAIAGFCPDNWICDIGSQLRLPLALILVICFVALLGFRSRIGCSIALIGLLINLVPVVQLSTANTRKNKPDKTTAIKILNFNTEFQHNSDTESLKQLIKDSDPDLIALVEVNKKWIKAIEPETRQYGWKKVVLTGPGIALFSRYEIEDCEVRYFGRSHHPRIIATIRPLKISLPVRVIVAHPTTPQTQSGFIERNEEFELIRREISSMKSPKMLIGDLNCGPWSPAFSNLLQAGLKDSELGYGPQPSWPARPGRVLDGVPVAPMVPIDHVLVSSDINVTERALGRPMNSDHLPVLVTVDVPLDPTAEALVAPKRDN